jgi:hypothetical protein
MALHDDERRTPRDYMHDSRTRYGEAGSGTQWVGILVAVALVAFILYILISAMGPNSTGEGIRQTPQNPTTTTAPRTTTPAPTAPTTQPQ